MATSFPTDHNTYAITDKIIRQTECQYKFGKKSGEFAFRFMGDTAEATQLAASYREDTIVPFSTLTSKFKELSVVNASQFEPNGKVVTSNVATKKGSALATVVVSVPYNSMISPELSSLDSYKVQTWAERTAKYQFGLEVYAGDISAGVTNYANAGDYEAWLNENGTNAENYKTFKYSLNGETVSLSGRTLELAKKHYAGIENVERGYPEVIRTTQYYYLKGDDVSADYQVMNKIDEEPNLYKTDSTPNAVWRSKFDGYSWLKTGYDVETQATEYERYWNATVTESWIGISEEERGAWDKNLYGTGNDRWKFYTALSGNGGNNNG